MERPREAWLVPVVRILDDMPMTATGKLRKVD